MNIKSELVRNILILMTGSTIAQAIPIAISPLLTRLYTPEDFGILALYISIASILAVIISMRYEIAIVQPVKDEDAIALVYLSLAIAFTLSMLLGIAIYFIKDDINHYLNADLGDMLYFIPITIFFIGCFRSLSYWNTRIKDFQNLSNAKVFQGGSAAAIQVPSAKIFDSFGLILGYFLSYLFSSLYLLKNFISFCKNKKYQFEASNIYQNAKTYQNMPKFSVWGALADSTSVQMPVFMIARFFELNIVGAFSLIFRVLSLPMSLIGQALSQVLYQRVVELSIENPKDLYKFIFKTFIFLVITTIPMIIIISFFGEGIFVFIFGESWRTAGAMSVVLVYAIAVRFAVSPLSTVLSLSKNIKLGVLWQFIYLLTLTSVLIYFRNLELFAYLKIFVIHELILYSLYFIFILIGSRNFRNY